MTTDSTRSTPLLPLPGRLTLAANGAKCSGLRRRRCTYSLAVVAPPQCLSVSSQGEPNRGIGEDMLGARRCLWITPSGASKTSKSVRTGTNCPVVDEPLAILRQLNCNRRSLINERPKAVWMSLVVPIELVWFVAGVI